MKQTKKNFIICTILIIFTCVIFIPFLQGHNMSDTYNIIEKGLDQYSVTNSFTDGRIIMGLLSMIVFKLNIPIMAYVIISLLTAIIISCIVVVIIKNAILEYRPSEKKWLEVIVTAISYVTIFNFMYIDNLVFLECIVMALSLLLYTISAKMLVNKTKGYIWKCALCTTVGMVAYQGTIGFFIALVLLFSAIKNKDKISNIFKDIALCGMFIVISGLVDLLCIKIFTQNLGTNQGRLNQNILYNIDFIFKGISRTLTNTCDVFPKNLLIFFLSILVVLGVVSILEKYKNKSTKELILWFALILLVILSGFASSVLATSAFYEARMRFSIGALIGILLLYLYVETDLFQKKNILTIIATLFLVVYIGCNLYQYIKIIDISKKMNQIEEQDCFIMENYIKEYEQKTGIQVTKMARIITGEHSGRLHLIDDKTSNNYVRNATKCGWSAKGVMYFYTGRRLEYTKATVEGMRELETSGQEFECVGDTLYIYIYVN